MSDFTPPVRLRLDGDALVANWHALSRLSGTAETGAAVKADGYGLGARKVVAQLRNAGCQNFFVAHWNEASAIADLVPPSQIAVLNGIPLTDIAAAIALGAIPVLNSPEQIAFWKLGQGGRCHVMLDSGINRLGIGPEQLAEGLFDGLDIDILMSHLASADEDSGQNLRQRNDFIAMSQSISHKRRSLANSAGIMLGRDYHFDLTRPGLALYGGIPRSELIDEIRQVAYFEAQVLQLRDLQAAETVGYNATYICDTPTRVATLAIGYADGYFRGFSNKGSCYFERCAMPVIGRVSMDLVTMDASNAKNLKAGDWVSIDFELANASRISGLSQYELLTSLGARFERNWI
jgi:alanine racemase